MKIEAGKYYRRRCGDVVGPLTKVTWCDRTFMAADMTWHENGSYVLGLENEYDLIAEVYVSDTPPADAPETKTLLDEFAKVIVGAFLSRPLSENELTLEQCQIVWSNAAAMMEARKK